MNTCNAARAKYSPSYNYVNVVPLDQKIHNTPYHLKKFSDRGLKKEDTPLDTLTELIANNEFFKAPSSNAVYHALEHLRNTTFNLTLQLKTYIFEEPLLTWNVNHNQDTFYFNVNIFDNENNKIYANVKIINNNNFNVEFTEPTSGFITITFGV